MQLPKPNHAQKSISGLLHVGERKPDPLNIEVYAKIVTNT